MYTIIFINTLGEILKVTASSFNKAYTMACEVGFEVYDYEVEEGEEFCAV